MQTLLVALIRTSSRPSIILDFIIVCRAVRQPFAARPYVCWSGDREYRRQISRLQRAEAPKGVGSRTTLVKLAFVGLCRSLLGSRLNCHRERLCAHASATERPVVPRFRHAEKHQRLDSQQESFRCPQCLLETPKLTAGEGVLYVSCIHSL
jgi:hypothetical protein